MNNKLLTIQNLQVSFGRTKAVRGVSFSISEGEIFALVGESGSGKSVTAGSILGLNPSANTTGDELTLSGVDLLTATEKKLDTLRGKTAGMVFQDPMTALNPTMKIGRQITERLYRKEGFSLSQCRAEAIRLLNQVQISNAPLRAEQYPHQLSGGMRQRVMIAMAIACRPALLIADEPTTALDVTTQLQILKLLGEIRRDTNTAILLITHDLGVVANLADRVGVMLDGRMVETCSVSNLFEHTAHEYTKTLLTDFTQMKKDTPTLSYAQYTGQQGCSYAGRCAYCMRICLKEQPPHLQIRPEHTVACWRFYSQPPKE